MTKIKVEDFANKISDSKFLESVLEVYADKLIGFINNIIFDIHFAEDIMMDVFVDVIVKKPVFENEGMLKAYLYKCAKNKALNYIKRNKRLVLLSEDVLQDTAELSEKLYQTQTNKILLEAMNKLKVEYRQVLYLSFFEDMTAQEICEALEIDDKKLRNIKHRAKLKLNKVLREKNFKIEV